MTFAVRRWPGHGVTVGDLDTAYGVGAHLGVFTRTG